MNESSSAQAMRDVVDFSSEMSPVEVQAAEPEYFHRLVNLEDHPDFLATARAGSTTDTSRPCTGRTGSTAGSSAFPTSAGSGGSSPSAASRTGW